jgi:hypothetical protein
MFCIATMGFATEENLEFISFVTNREFPGDDEFPPGPIGYLSTISSNKIELPLAISFPLNQWLADGLLVSFVQSTSLTPFHIDLSAVSLLGSFFCEPLVYRGLLITAVSRLYWYVFESSAR